MGVSVCGIVLLSSWGPETPKCPHEDSKMREILPRGYISHVSMKTKAIFILGVRFRVRIRVKG